MQLCRPVIKPRQKDGGATLRRVRYCIFIRRDPGISASEYGGFCYLLGEEKKGIGGIISTVRAELSHVSHGVRACLIPTFPQIGIGLGSGVSQGSGPGPKVFSVEFGQQKRTGNRKEVLAWLLGDHRRI